MAQSPSTPATRYEPRRRPEVSDGYPQRIEIWNALAALGSGNRNEVYRELEKRGHKRPLGAKMDERYVRIELTDMCKRGFIRRIEG
jgi:hypothetical protein